MQKLTKIASRAALRLAVALCLFVPAATLSAQQSMQGKQIATLDPIVKGDAKVDDVVKSNVIATVRDVIKRQTSINSLNISYPLAGILGELQKGIVNPEHLWLVGQFLGADYICIPFITGEASSIHVELVLANVADEGAYISEYKNIGLGDYNLLKKDSELLTYATLKRAADAQNVYSLTLNGNTWKFLKNGSYTEPFNVKDFAYAKNFHTLKNIYLAGSEKKTNAKSIAIINKNGSKFYELTDGKYDAYAIGVFVLGGTVFVSDSDVYVAGYEKNPQNKGIATVWENGGVKNNGTTYPLTNGRFDASARSVFVSNGDVYAAGYEKNIKGDDPFLYKKEPLIKIGRFKMLYRKIKIPLAPEWGNDAKIWKNGKLHYNLTDGSRMAEAYSVFVSGGDVYAAGYEKISGEDDKNNVAATVWKNGKLHYRLTNGNTYAMAYSVTVLGGDVYAAGYEKTNPNDKPIAIVWKNGSVLYRFNEGAAWLAFAR